ncbi:hypothetical protein J3Q64DRAFT_1704066 [Phycomyces blakesleeanus]|uniref:Uncharacterized protein n=1 Tax=Phycomyces blakesleeanus TaxID=4837 RepID=A0ABR3AJI8_PHYBL
MEIGLQTNQVSDFAVYGMEYPKKNYKHLIKQKIGELYILDINAFNMSKVCDFCNSKYFRYFQDASGMSWRQKTCSILCRKFGVATVGQKSSILNQDQQQQQQQQSTTINVIVPHSGRRT